MGVPGPCPGSAAGPEGAGADDPPSGERRSASGADDALGRGALEPARTAEATDSASRSAGSFTPPTTTLVGSAGADAGDGDAPKPSAEGAGAKESEEEADESGERRRKTGTPADAPEDGPEGSVSVRAPGVCLRSFFPPTATAVTSLPRFVIPDQTRAPGGSDIPETASPDEPPCPGITVHPAYKGE
jgi:hypothetical protein